MYRQNKLYLSIIHTCLIYYLYLIIYEIGIYQYFVMENVNTNQDDDNTGLFRQ